MGAPNSLGNRTHTNTHTHTLTYLRIHTHTYTHIRSHPYTYTHTHMLTHTHIYTHTSAKQVPTPEVRPFYSMPCSYDVIYVCIYTYVSLHMQVPDGGTAVLFDAVP